ncbi:DNA polymerase IV [[Actinomadura] parvosata subsp. kistnae]|uniref:DNA polymerase IV n=1 Tax=[Actinomadura] parvosata subsp. kistnae TaxID=1909395 RepID=A0A1U9ZTA6_9ACTN|nr:DNA polymerase IV [Nonomuraea sp. ATCC 55076]AQZ61172.1 DNA polymerase IV [Nonomuraea sp. ATCC 55076]
MATRNWILHLDLDQFIAAVELLRHPELRGRPVVVGGTGDPTQPRTVAATATYEAREHGIHSGMPLRTALRRCPDAVFLPSDPPSYEAASARVMAVLREFPVHVEVWGWDEAFLGATTDDPEALAADLQHAVRARTHLDCSIGIGDNKHQAKLASAFAKPAGIYRLTTETWAATMNHRPTDALWGIGTKISAKLAAHGLHTVAQLAAADPADLARHFGPTNGPWYRYLALGKGEAEVVTTPWIARGHSRETTFPHDLTDPAAIATHLATLAQQVAHDAADAGRTITRVTVKIRTTPFQTRTRQTKLPTPTTDPATITRTALDILDRHDLTHPVRLIGVAVEYTMPKT